LRNGARVAEAAPGDDVALIVNQTPFYAEAGGQVGDTGIVFSAGGAELAVRDTIKKAGDLHVHLGNVTRGVVKEGDAVELRVDGRRRRQLRANHSVTHLLHEALRRQLGEHVTQKGSLVAPDRLRFDFSHPRALTAEDILAIETEVNERIRANSAVQTRLLTPDRAVAEGVANQPRRAAGTDRRDCRGTPAARARGRRGSPGAGECRLQSQNGRETDRRNCL
jgi:alanyl-tRNA synthetase